MKLANSFIIAVDFDGTIAERAWPDIGPAISGAIEWIKRFKEMGCYLILWTSRRGDELQSAIAWCEQRGIAFNACNPMPEAGQSPKVYANVYIDDAAIGCPVTTLGVHPAADWSVIGPEVERRVGLVRMRNAMRGRNAWAR